MRQLDVQHRGLNRVEPRVESHPLMDVSHGRSEIPQRSNLRCQAIVVRGDGATVPVGAEILPGIEAEAGSDAERPALLPAVRRAVRLCSVLDDVQAALVRQRQERIDIGWLAVQVDGHDGPCALRHGRQDRRHVDGRGALVAVHEDGSGACVPDRLGRGDERVRRKNDFVAGADAEPPQNQVQGVGSARHTDAVAHAEIRGECRFERRDRLSQDEVGTRARLVDRSIELRRQPLVLSGQVHQRNTGHHFSSGSSGWAGTPTTTRSRRHVVNHHGAGADPGAFADGQPAEDHGSRSDRGATLHNCRLEHPCSPCARSRWRDADR